MSLKSTKYITDTLGYPWIYWLSQTVELPRWPEKNSGQLVLFRVKQPRPLELRSEKAIQAVDAAVAQLVPGKATRWSRAYTKSSEFFFTDSEPRDRAASLHIVQINLKSIHCCTLPRRWLEHLARPVHSHAPHTLSNSASACARRPFGLYTVSFPENAYM